MAGLRASDLDDMQRVPLFADLDRDSLATLTRSALLQRFPAQTRLFEMGDRPDFLHVLLDGSVQLSAEDAAGRDVHPTVTSGGHHVTRPTQRRTAPRTELVPMSALRARRLDGRRGHGASEPLSELPVEPSCRRHPG